MTARNGVGLLLSDDLIFISRIAGTARDLGHTVMSAGNVDALLELVPRQQPTAILMDLACPGLDLVEFVSRLEQEQSPPPRLIAYGSHVDTESLKAAREAGCEVVLPRSKFVEVLPDELAGWLSSAEGS